jgi:hypothetical protein
MESGIRKRLFFIERGLRVFVALGGRSAEHHRRVPPLLVLGLRTARQEISAPYLGWHDLTHRMAA